MAVYEHTYKRYEGRLTPDWSRFLIIPRHAYRDVFRSKLFTAFFALCFIYPLIAAILIYLHHNASALAILKIDVTEVLPINGSFFLTYMSVQGALAFFVNLLVGPPLVSRDLANNALPLYLCRPLSRSEYVLGKMSVVMILLSLMTWVPGLLLFLFQSYLEGFGWFAHNLWIASGIFLGSWIWIILLALLSQAVSAWVKWRTAASAALLGLYFIPSIFGEVINAIFVTRWGHIISLSALLSNVWTNLFGVYKRETARVPNFGGRGVREIEMFEPP
ncbi:MAG TPA: hypothetical protein VF507_00845, partial [Pyrinomonadaceae bacterium]